MEKIMYLFIHLYLFITVQLKFLCGVTSDVMTFAKLKLNQEK